MTEPVLSIIVPAVNRYSDLRDSLTAALAQTIPVDIIVVDRLGPHIREALARDFPAVTVLPMPFDATIPAMRELGIARAKTPFIGVIEDHVILPPDWGERMLAALDEGYDVVGGSIENAATETLIDWASFLCEYSASLPPLPSGPSNGVPGNNVVYRSETLRRYESVLAEHRWENRLHDAMRVDGVVLMMRPDIVVGHKMHYTFKLYLTQRFLYSRSYAGGRVAGESMPKRLIYAGATAILPPLLFYRTVSRIVSKKKHLGELVKSLPMLAVFVVSWALGETVGYLLGPGTAMSKVR